MSENLIEAVCLAISGTENHYIPHHRCGICDEFVGYLIRNGDVYFDSRCGCSSISQPQPRPRAELAAFILEMDEVNKKSTLTALGVTDG